MNKKQSQSGSVHLILTIVLCLALVGALGFIFYQNFIKDSIKDSITVVSPRDIQRKNDTAQLASAIANYVDGHKKLPSDLELTDGSFVNNYIMGGFGGTWESPSREEYSIELTGNPDINSFVFVRGKNCDGVAGDTKSSVKIKLESGEEYCQSN